MMRFEIPEDMSSTTPLGQHCSNVGAHIPPGKYQKCNPSGGTVNAFFPGIAWLVRARPGGVENTLPESNRIPTPSGNVR